MKEFLIEAGAAVIIIFLFVLYVQHKEHVAYDQGRTSMAQERDKQDLVNNNAALEEQERRTTKALLDAHYYKDMLEGLEKKSAQENKDHEQALQKARTAALAGNSGMQCPSNPTASQVAGQPSRTTGTVTGTPSAQGRTNLLPEAAGTILSIAEDSARLVRDRNELIDMYNAAVATCNATPPARTQSP